MANSTSNVWIDTTFVGEALFEPMETNKDTNVQLQFVLADNIGGYSVPVIYTQEHTSTDEIDIVNSYFQQLSTISGIQNVSTTYNTFSPPKMDGVVVALTEFNTGNAAVSGTLNKTITYFTGYNSISGSLDKYIAFIAGREMLTFVTVASVFKHTEHKDIFLDWWVNYTDFSGNLTNSGIPIPFYYTDYSITTEYGEDFEYFSLGWLNNIVDISFAGWIGFPIYSDIYSTLLGTYPGYRTEITTISGNVDVHYIDLFSTILTTSGVECDTYCALTDLSHIQIETWLTPGRISYIETDIYSTIESENALILDINLLSLKIANFSLGIGEYTTASNFVYVDVLDDECPVSVSGTYFMVNDTQVPVTLSGIEDGYRMFYNPEDDFSSLEGPTTLTVHAENECGKILEQDFYLTFGYIVEYFNRPELQDNIDYGFGNKIAVRVTAENYASCPKNSSLAWDFRSKSQFNNDLSASIVGRFHAWENSDMPATIYPQSTAYFYGKEFRIVVKAKDFAGNQMEPLILAYRIEDKP